MMRKKSISYTVTATHVETLEVPENMSPEQADAIIEKAVHEKANTGGYGSLMTLQLIGVETPLNQFKKKLGES